MSKKLFVAAAIAATLCAPLAQAQQKQIKSIGITLGSLGNPLLV